MTDKIRWGLDSPHPLSQMKTELIWEGKYDEYENQRTVDIAGCAMTLLPVRTSLPRWGGGQVRTQTGCTAAQAGRSACWIAEHGMKCLCLRG